jgi:hypothetical protein
MPCLRLPLVLGLVLSLPPAALAQAPVPTAADPLNAYLQSPALHAAVATLGSSPTGSRDRMAIDALLPLANGKGFIDYVIATRPGVVARSVESLRLDKVLASATGNGGTSAVSSAIGPAILGAAVEYGGVLQESTGTTTTLRFNALGVAKLVAGAEQFPYCPAIDAARCAPWPRALRRVSGAVSFEPKSTATADTPAPAAPATSQLLGSDFQVTSWSVRVELREAGRLDDPGYVARWTAQMAALRSRPQPAALSEAFSALFGAQDVSVYEGWLSETRAQLQQASPADLRQVLAARLDALVDAYLDADPTFATRVLAAAQAYEGYYQARDEMVMQAMAHKSSVEFTHRSPLGQPGMSNVRYIYSHQPAEAPLLVTLNGAVTLYDTKPAAGGRLRDVQLAAQLDRRLDELPALGPSVFTLAAYYQYMKSDAILEPGVAALSGLVLADGSAAVLGTKGHIGVLQAKLSVPLGEVVKVPFSVTWSNRRELIPEKSTFRGQVGLAIDVDALMR